MNASERRSIQVDRAALVMKEPNRRLSKDTQGGRWVGFQGWV